MNSKLQSNKHPALTVQLASQFLQSGTKITAKRGPVWTPNLSLLYEVSNLMPALNITSPYETVSVVSENLEHYKSVYCLQEVGLQQEAMKINGFL